MKVVYFPQRWKTVQYLDMMIEAYKEGGFEVRQGFISKIFLKKNWDVNYMPINSLDTAVAKQKNFITAYLLYFFLLINLYIVKKVFKVNIIWVFHDKEVHEKSDLKYANVGNKLFKFYPKLSDKIMIHSSLSKKVLIDSYGRSIQKKIHYVAHPNYINRTGMYNPKESLSNTTLKIISLGALNPYKNIDVFINVLTKMNPKNVEFTIAGGGEESYIEKLKNQIEECPVKIKTSFKRVSNEDMAKYYSENHLVITPYSSKSSLNSGSIINAFSYHRTVLSSENGTLLDIPEKDWVFGYQVDDESQQFERIYECLENLIDGFSGRFDQLLILGEKCYKYVEKNNSYQTVARQLIEMLE